MNQIEEARSPGTASTQAGTRVGIEVSAEEQKSIVLICPACGEPMHRGAFNRWKYEWSYWCRNPDCEDHMSPVRVPA
jgi:predicted RNA-binding Zn-ribbon protein involved in translation (DUF1610 family)